MDSADLVGDFGFSITRLVVLLNLIYLYVGEQFLPDSIAGLKKLEELNVSSNLLSSLPDSIGLLLNLKILNVSGNKLNALPDSIAGCRYSVGSFKLFYPVWYSAANGCRCYVLVVSLVLYVLFLKLG